MPHPNDRIRDLVDELYEQTAPAEKVADVRASQEPEETLLSLSGRLKTLDEYAFNYDDLYAVKSGAVTVAEVAEPVLTGDARKDLLLKTAHDLRCIDANVTSWKIKTADRVVRGARALMLLNELSRET